MSEGTPRSALHHPAASAPRRRLRHCRSRCRHRRCSRRQRRSPGAQRRPPTEGLPPPGHPQLGGDDSAAQTRCPPVPLMAAVHPPAVPPPRPPRGPSAWRGRHGPSAALPLRRTLSGVASGGTTGWWGVAGRGAMRRGAWVGRVARRLSPEKGETKEGCIPDSGGDGDGGGGGGSGDGRGEDGGRAYIGTASSTDGDAAIANGWGPRLGGGARGGGGGGVGGAGAGA